MFVGQKQSKHGKSNSINQQRQTASNPAAMTAVGFNKKGSSSDTQQKIQAL